VLKAGEEMFNMEHHETAISYDHEEGLVHVYTTREDVYSGFLGVGLKPLQHRSLNPGYELVYPLSQCQDPASLLHVNI
jgi:hypothetical protein